MARTFVIHVEEVSQQTILGFELEEFTRDEAIVILSRCLHRLVSDYDDALRTHRP